MKEKAQSIYDKFPELSIVEKRFLNKEKRKINSFVLRNTQLRSFQIDAVEKYYPTYGLKFKDEKIDFKEVFDNDKPVVIEIGFGDGQSTQRIAKERSEYNYLAIEVFLNGYAKLLSVIGDEKLENVRLMRFNAVDVLNSMIENESIAGFHIFFPDPWPKKKHHKRRLIQEEFTNLLSSKLKKGGYIYCVTDWQEYADQMLEVLSNTENMENPFDGFAPSRDWRPTTKYEKRGIDLDYNINEVWFEKK